jgi:acetoin utilization protein AcuB
MNRSDLKREQLQQVFQEAAGKHWSDSVSVRAVMTPQPFCVTPEHTAAKIVELFHAHGFRHFLVADGGRLVGVISDRDVIRLFGANDSLEPAYLESVSVADLMSTDLITIPANATLADATTRIIEHGINCLPVVENGQAIGILTSTDLFLSLEQVLKAVAAEQASV